MTTNNLSLLRKGRPFIMRGAYIVLYVRALSPPRPSEAHTYKST
jgi:hypothetical protein